MIELHYNNFYLILISPDVVSMYSLLYGSVPTTFLPFGKPTSPEIDFVSIVQLDVSSK